MGKKTFKVEDLIEMVNTICQDSDPGFADVRRGAMNVAEQILHETRNYSGFRYLITGECSGNPGVNYDGKGPLSDYVERFKNTDPTRVQYYLP